MKKCREELINEEETLTMEKAMQIVQNYEYCQKQLSSMAPSSHDVDVVSRRPGKGARPKAPPRTTLSMVSRPSQANNNVETAVLPMRKGNVLLTENSATNVIKNHFQKCCCSTSFVYKINNDDASDSAKYVTGQCENSFDQEYFIDTVNALSSVSLSPDRAFAPLLIGPNQNPMQFKIDTGSAINILPHSQFKSLNMKYPVEALSMGTCSQS